MDRRVSVQEKVDAAFWRKERGEKLTEHDWILIQYTLGADACPSCGKPGMVIAARDAGSHGANGGER